MVAGRCEWGGSGQGREPGREGRGVGVGVVMTRQELMHADVIDGDEVDRMVDSS